MKDELISREAVLKIVERYSLSRGSTIGKHSGTVEILMDKIEELPSVPAIPIDKLCEWLTEIDMPLADACPWIDKYYHVCTQCDFFQRPIKECWKEILSKLMEEQNEVDRCGQTDKT